MDYGYLTAKSTYESVEDVAYYALESPHNTDAIGLLENLSKLDYDHEDAQRLRKFIEWASDTNEESWKFFDASSEKEGSRKLLEFSQDIEDMVERKTGIKWVIRLTDNPQFDDPDEIINKYKTGKLLYTDMDYVRLYGYKEPPRPIEPTREEIFDYLRSHHDVIMTTNGIHFDDDDVFFVLQKQHPMEAFEELLDFKSQDQYDSLQEEIVDSLREEFPMFSREDLEEYFFDSVDMQPMTDQILDQEYCCVLELGDSSFPIMESDQGPTLSDKSSLELLYEKMGYSYEDVNKALLDGVPDKINSFPSSLSAEYAVTGDDPNLSAVILLRCTLRELLDKENPNVKIPAGSRCGFFDSLDGSGGEFKVMIEKDLVMPRKAFSYISVDYSPPGSRLYSIRETYSSLGDDLWNPLYSSKDLKKLASQAPCR